MTKTKVFTIAVLLGFLVVPVQVHGAPLGGSFLLKSGQWRTTLEVNNEKRDYELTGTGSVEGKVSGWGFRADFAPIDRLDLMARLGFNRFTVTGEEKTDLGFSFGLGVGYDFLIIDNWFAGTQLSFMTGKGDKDPKLVNPTTFTIEEDWSEWQLGVYGGWRKEFEKSDLLLFGGLLFHPAEIDQTKSGTSINSSSNLESEDDIGLRLGATLEEDIFFGNFELGFLDGTSLSLSIGARWGGRKKYTIEQMQEDGLIEGDVYSGPFDFGDEEEETEEEVIPVESAKEEESKESEPVEEKKEEVSPPSTKSPAPESSSEQKRMEKGSAADTATESKTKPAPPPKELIPREFFLYKNGEVEGPLTEDQIKEKVSKGLLDPNSLATPTGKYEWKQLWEYIPALK